MAEAKEEETTKTSDLTSSCYEDQTRKENQPKDLVKTKTTYTS